MAAPLSGPPSSSVAANHVNLVDPRFLSLVSKSRSFKNVISGSSAASSFPNLKPSTHCGMTSLWISEELSVGFLVTLLDSRHVLIKLENDLDYSRIFVHRSYFVFNCFMKIIKWSPFFDISAESPIVPIWISFPELRLHFFCRRILHGLDSLFGRPLQIDNATTMGSRPSVVRVLVELDVTKQYPSSIWLGPENMVMSKKMLGHKKADCFQLNPDLKKKKDVKAKALVLDDAPKEGNDNANGAITANDIEHEPISTDLIISLDCNEKVVNKKVDFNDCLKDTSVSLNVSNMVPAIVLPRYSDSVKSPFLEGNKESDALGSKDNSQSVCPSNKLDDLWEEGEINSDEERYTLNEFSKVSKALVSLGTKDDSEWIAIKSKNSILIWNVRGVAKLDTWSRIRNLCRIHNITLLVLLEPMVHHSKISVCKRQLGFDNAFSSYSGKNWTFGNCSKLGRTPLWHNLSQFSSSLCGPWFVPGGRLKQCLRCWNKNKFGNIFDNIINTENLVADLEGQLALSIEETDRELIRMARTKLLHLKSVEEEYWRQKVASKFLTEGERKSRFFHNLVNSKRAKSIIKSIKMESGDYYEDSAEIIDSVINYFKNSFGVSKNVYEISNPEMIHSLHLTHVQSINICNATSFSSQVMPLYYLGTPLFKGHKQSFLFDKIFNSIAMKISGWESKVLSMGARLLFIKSVMCSMPVYLLQTINPTKFICERLEKRFNKFFWGSTDSYKKIHWTNWNACMSFWGRRFGLQIYYDLIRSFSFKLWWKFRKNGSLWANYMHKKYCDNTHPSLCFFKQGQSPGWKRLCNLLNGLPNLLFNGASKGVIFSSGKMIGLMWGLLTLTLSFLLSLL
ncbi:hypothetical protein M5K25_016012 [Dendrobium thyrsiflorum]|uniref:DUF4283 domain-containing protein n=1 Tax=Dendrobium thyrsiflorum TaxID=117978 RepID=A0ABD0USG1_DENTH